MSCGCNKGKRDTRGSTPATVLNTMSSNRRIISSPSNGAVSTTNLTPPIVDNVMDQERLRIERLRREAIRRSLGR
jgi:hypothetical protein